ncbi:hypothetical protein CEXT_33671 [Caerostris extrusa]|uniref:Uncharacterized protein n=1 Tax=Caerostris extrusa TaxID=172846 RepID=A0AAV4PTG6_CAEEX|nr:hypothetical protein CEXT_33671 [Caerostris extrusa]
MDFSRSFLAACCHLSENARGSLLNSASPPIWRRVPWRGFCLYVYGRVAAREEWPRSILFGPDIERGCGEVEEKVSDSVDEKRFTVLRPISVPDKMSASPFQDR